MKHIRVVGKERPLTAQDDEITFHDIAVWFTGLMDIIIFIVSRFGPKIF